jgi:hypothetical protein
VTDVLSLIDNALEDYETSADAMRWSPGSRYARSSSRRCQRVIDQPCPGMRLVPFVGGPWHGDLRALPPDDFRLVLAPLSATLGYTTYTLVAAWIDLPHGLVDGVPVGGWRGRIRVARAQDATEADLNEVLSGLLFAGWQPWLPPGSQPCVGEARR